MFFSSPCFVALPTLSPYFSRYLYFALSIISLLCKVDRLTDRCQPTSKVQKPLKHPLNCMGDVDISQDDFSASSSPALQPVDVTYAPDLTKAVDQFLDEGYPSVIGVLRAFSMMDLPEELRVMILRVVAKYLNVLYQARKEQGMSLPASHFCANNAVLGDTHVAKMIEDLMSQGVASIVSKAVN